MWQNKRFMIVSGLVAVVLLVGSIGVAVLADDSEGTTLWDRVGAIYQELTGDVLDQEALDSAIDQARKEMREEALENRLQNLVDEGKMTQEQADEYLEWWQAKPDVPVAPGFGGHGEFGGRGGFCPTPTE